MAQKQGGFRSFLSELQHIFFDIVFMYRNFIHWNISKILILIWSLILGIIFMIPVFLVAIIIGIIDPIVWTDLASATLSNAEPSFEIITSLAEHPYWLGLMIGILAIGFLCFLLGSSYVLLLLARLSVKYIQRKKLSLKKNLYFSKTHIKAFVSITTRNSLICIVPIFLGIFLLGILHFSGLTGGFFNGAVIGTVLTGGIGLIYILYRIIFGYIILAHQKKSEEVHTGKTYVGSSLSATTLKNFWKFLFLLLLYVGLMAPFNNYEIYLEKQMQYMASALAYKTGQVETISDSEKKYYEYVSAQYGKMSNTELQERIMGVSKTRILYSVILYFIFGGLGVMLLTSFYVRVILQKSET